MKALKKLATQKTNKKKGMMISVAVHGALLLLALIPMASQIDIDDDPDSEYVIPIEFAEFSQSSEEGLQAKSPVDHTEHKPVTEEKELEPDIVEVEEVDEVAQLTEEVEPVESEIIEEEAQEVVAAEDEAVSDDAEAATEGGTESTLADGPVEGMDDAGEDIGQNGLDGDGVITRKIIYRQDITQAAKHTGMIVVDICIDRRGKVLTARNNTVETTIQDMDMVREALSLTVGYRFETDYSAARRECGSLTFIFEIEGDTEYAEYALNE
jgi:hypothetical protein